MRTIGEIEYGRLSMAVKRMEGRLQAHKPVRVWKEKSETQS